MTQASITAVHGYVPDHILTNQMLEKMVDTNDEWIQSRTGIQERRILKGEGKATSDMAVEVVNGIIEKTGISKDSIDLLICGTVTADMVFPDTANTICAKAGLTKAFGFDINAACSGFLYSLYVGANLIKSQAYKRIIVIGADMMSSIIDYEDRATCIIFGDGAGGVLLEPAIDDNGIIDAVLKGDGNGRHHLHMKAGGSLKPASAETVANKEHYVYQEGRTVFKSAVNGMSSSIKEVMERNELAIDDIKWVVPHQANMRIINTVCDMVDFPKERVMLNIQKYGNTTAATLPLCLWNYEDQLQKGDNIILTAFGGGFTWGALYLKWAY